MADEPFWRRKRLDEMSRQEWESLCDGCGKCCLLKLVDEDTEEIHYTDVACRLLNTDTCRCTRYRDRQKLVPDCVQLEPSNIGELSFMPSTCAYRLLAQGQDLPWWHPLVSGRKDTVYKAGASAKHRIISEDEVEEDDLPKHIVSWAR